MLSAGKTRRRHTDGLRNQLGKDIFLVMLRDSRDNGRQWGLCSQGMLFGDLTPQFVEVDISLGFLGIALRFIFLDEGIRNIGASSHKTFILRGKFGIFLRLGKWRHSHCSGRHLE